MIFEVLQLARHHGCGGILLSLSNMDINAVVNKYSLVP